MLSCGSSLLGDAAGACMDLRRVWINSRGKNPHGASWSITPALVQKVSEPCPAWGSPGMYFQCIYPALALPLTSVLAARGCIVLCSNPSLP